MGQKVITPLYSAAGSGRGTKPRPMSKEIIGTITGIESHGKTHFILQVATREGGKSIMAHESHVGGLQKGAEYNFVCRPNKNASNVCLAAWRLAKEPTLSNQPKGPSHD